MQVNFDILIRSACVPCEAVATATTQATTARPRIFIFVLPPMHPSYAYPRIWDKPCVTRPIGYPAAVWPRASETSGTGRRTQPRRCTPIWTVSGSRTVTQSGLLIGWASVNGLARRSAEYARLLPSSDIGQPHKCGVKLGVRGRG
jgi:hypothetical protein